MPEEPNFLAHAFRSQYNLIGLVTALGFAILSGSGLPLLLMAGASLVILPLVAGSERFQRVVRMKLEADAKEQKQQTRRLEASEMIKVLPEAERHRYRGLETLAGEIRENYRGLDSSSQSLLEDVEGKLDFLIAFYLRMRYSVARYEAYFQTTDPERIRRRIAGLDREIGQSTERVRQIKAKTKDVLQKRLERYEKALENRQLVDAQTETVLEVLQLLRDQSFSMRDPKTITEQLDGLVSSAEETERGVRDLEDLLANDQELFAAGNLGVDVDEELASSGLQKTAPPPVRLPPAAGATPAATPDRKKVTH